jgi:hypothetical protein
MGLTVDAPLSQEILEELSNAIGAQRTRFITLPE